MKEKLEYAIMASGAIAGGSLAHWFTEWPDKVTPSFLFSAFLIYGWLMLLGAVIPAIIMFGSTEQRPGQTRQR